MDTLGGMTRQSFAEVCIEVFPDFISLNEDEQQGVTREAVVWVMLMQNVILDCGVTFPYPTEGERFEMLSSFLAIQKTRLEGVNWIGGKEETQKWWRAIARQLNKQGDLIKTGLPAPLSINKDTQTFYVSSREDYLPDGKVNLVLVGDRLDEYELGMFEVFATKEGVRLEGFISIEQVVLTTYSALPEDFKWGLGAVEMTKEECRILNRFPHNTDPVLTVVAITKG